MKLCSRCKALLAPDARVCPADDAPAEDVEQLPMGAKIGAYRIDKLLGEGGMGFVYEATHEVLHRRTAIKFLRPEFANHGNVVTRFLQEAKAVNVIDHANIINIYDYGDGADGSVYFVMEYLEGETLEDLMRKRRPMAAPLLLHVFAQIGKALAAAHDKQIVHRDLKPANIYVIAREGNPHFIKLLDFGIAQLRGEGRVDNLTVAGSVMGTPQFMSPEQIMGKTVDARTDVWAFGVMLYKAATGHAPFKGDSFQELGAKILSDSPKRPREAAPEANIVDALDALIMKCLERELPARCPSIKAALEGFAKVKTEYGLDDEAILAAVRADAGAIDEPMPKLRSEPTKASLAGSMPQYQGAVAEPRAATKGKTGVWIAVGAAAIALGAGGYAVLRSGGEPPAPVAKATEPAKPPPPAPRATIKDKLAAGDAKAVHDLAHGGLADAMASGNLQLEGQAIDAIALAGAVSEAPLLYVALDGAPDLRLKAARALGELALPDAAPKVRAALDASGDKLKVELAAALYGLGDKDALAILRRAVSDPGMRLTAAVALAKAGDDKAARPVLEDILGSTPEGRDQWRRAAAGLAQLGDTKGHDALAAELAQPDAARAVTAAAILAERGDDKAHAYLARVAADKDFARRAEAAAALAKLGDKAALDWVPDGLHSTVADERKLAASTCARLARSGGDRFAKDLAGLASDDPDPAVRLVADAALLAL